jgi:hypothetical protein
MQKGQKKKERIKGKRNFQEAAGALALSHKHPRAKGQFSAMSLLFCVSHKY